MGGKVCDDAWNQSTCAVSEGGLGYRTPEVISLPAFVASRIAARPGAYTFFKRLEVDGLVQAGALQELYDIRLVAAEQRLLGLCHATPLADQARDIMKRSAEAAERAWLEAAGMEPETALPEEEAAQAGVQELEDFPGLPRASHLQRALSKILDQKKLAELSNKLLMEGRTDDLRRISDLRDPPGS